MKALIRSALLSVACVVALNVAPASAQHAQGFWFSGGLGYGSLGCDNCDGRQGALTGGLSFGGTLSDKLLLAVGTTGWSKSDEGATLTVGTLDARLRFYPMGTSGLFLTGGLGFGTIRADLGEFGSQSEVGLGVVLGLGFDVPVASNLSMTPFWNGYGVRTSNGDANVGQLGLAVTVH